MITSDLQIALDALRNGDIAAVPTETVYGLAANAYSEEAIAKIFALKGRPLYNPLIVHIKSLEFLQNVAREIPAIAYQLAQEFWPGPLTLVLKKKPHIPDIVTAGKDTVAVRVPNHPLTLELLQQLDFPFAAPSANPFGSISPTCPLHVEGYFGDDLQVILDGGNCIVGLESTIIGFEEDLPVLYRLGSLSVEEVEFKVGKIKMKTLDDSSPSAPGMLSRHYAPSTYTCLSHDVANTIKKQSGKRIGLLLFQKRIEGVHVQHQEILSKKGDMEEAAKNLYAAMHHVDALNLDIIIAERFPDVGLGKTINDKLQRASKL